MKLGIIQETKLKGRKIILEPRKGLPANLYWVSKGEFLNGSERFVLHCLVCEKEVINKCLTCNNLKQKNAK